MTIDLDVLEKVAREAHADWASKVPTMPLRTYHTTFSPATALALIAEIRELQAKLDLVKLYAEADRRCPCCTGYETILDVLGGDAE